MQLMPRLSKLLRCSGLVVKKCACEKYIFFFVDAFLISKAINVDLSVLLASGGYLIIHDAVNGSSNDNTIRFSEFKVKHAIIGSLIKQCVELTCGEMCC